MIVVLIMGLITGSFTGVVCHRIPRNESIFLPGSRCDSCLKPIAFCHNIPIVSFLQQKGICCYCGSKINRLYFTLEILTPVLFLILYYYYGLSILFFYKAFIFTVLMAASAVDIETYTIPDRFYIMLLIISFIYSSISNNLESWLLGTASYGFPLLLLYFISGIIQKEIIGFGDIKLMYAVGGVLSYSGVKNLLLFYEILYLSSGFFALFLIFIRKNSLKSYAAFAPFRCFSAFICGVFL